VSIVDVVWRLAVALPMAALAAVFACLSGGNAGGARHPGDMSGGGHLGLSLAAGCLGGLAIAMTSFCRSRRAITTLSLCCASSWLLWALLTWLADPRPPASLVLLLACAAVAVTAFGALAIADLGARRHPPVRSTGW
jgi:hypothetical protein